MCSDIGQLQIEDDIPDLGERVMEEEVALLAPHLVKRLTEALGQTDGGKPNNQGGTLRPRFDRKTG
jgi:hypothetical protein